ncbi:MAG: hypothetical protein JXJ04_23910 [Spirochaetales bacterium]|nr:hypothetical protein [Spirochaetales bacterium]
MKKKLFGEIEAKVEEIGHHFTCPICGKELTVVVEYSGREFKNLFKYWKIIEKLTQLLPLSEIAKQGCNYFCSL